MYTVRDSYVGDGSTTQFGVTFPYMAQVHVYAEVDGVPVPRTFIGPSTVQITPAPAAGSVVLLYRQTDIDNLNYEFQLGAAFLPPYIDSNNKQLLYSVQESDTTARDATAAAADAGARADLATATANSALATAGTALSQSSTALSTANSAAAEASQAATDAAAAESSASAAQSAASAAQTAATAAQTAASSALTTAQTADTKATQAAADAAAALSTAGTANSTANAANATAGTALSTANTAAANASTALSTANGIDAKATQALSTAIAADAKADEALAAVGEAGVASWNGRSGIVTPQAGDYSAAEVSRGVSNVDADLTALEAGKADTGHTHSMSDVTGLNTFVSATDATLNDLEQRTDTAEAALSSTVVRQTASTGAAQLPVGTSAQRPTPATGHIRYNSEAVGAELYTGALWQTLWDTRMLKAPAGTLDMSTSSFLKPGSFGIGEAVPLANAADLDNVVRSGFYRLGSGYSTELSFGQMIVARGSDTILQIAGGQAGDLYFRAGSPPAVGGGGAYTGWINLTPTKTTNDGAPTRLIKNGDRQAVHAWVNFAGVGGIVTRGKYGINTVIRNGVGTYTIYYSKVFISDWYSCQVSCSRGAGINNLVSAAIIQQYYDAVLIEVTRESNGDRTNVDAEIVQVLIHGEYNNA